MDVFLGVDAGGTRTRALLVDAGLAVHGYGEAGPGNPGNAGFESAADAIEAAVRAAWAAAGEPFRPAAAAFAGVAGIKARGECARFGAMLAARDLAGAARCRAANDTEAALAGGLPGRPGIALIAGTGSFCLGRDEAGRVAACGGWGWLMDDVGSGYFLGREALGAVARAADGRGPATALTAQVFAGLGVVESDELLGRVYEPAPTPEGVARWAPVVLGAAAAGDKVAREILRAGAAGLAELVARVAAALVWSEPPTVVLTGGVARSGSSYEEAIGAEIAATVPGSRVVAPMLPAVAGAALRAAELGGVHVDAAGIERLRAGLHARGVAG